MTHRTTSPINSVSTNAPLHHGADIHSLSADKPLLKLIFATVCPSYPRILDLVRHPHRLLGKGNRRHGIVAVGVGPGVLAHGVVHLAAADDDLKAVSEPGLLTSSMVDFMESKATERKPERASTAGWLSLTAATKFSSGWSMPRSKTSKPLTSSMKPTMSLPMSWMSPRTVPKTTVPSFLVWSLSGGKQRF